MISFSDVEAAADRIRPYVHRTPVVTSSQLNELFGAELFFKCENLQKIGAFKARGATNAVMLLTDEQARNGVAAHSSGNHAQALAYAAKSRGIPCTIVMPDNSPTVKVNATKGYGATIIFCENTLRAREEMLNKVINNIGAHEIHPYDHPHVIAGQGTAALELIQDVEDLQVIMAPIGGGGLMSGTAVATRGMEKVSGGSAFHIMGVEPELANDAQLSLKDGRIHPPKPPITIADGLRTGLSERTYEHLSVLGVEVHTCSEKAIRDGMRLVLERLKLVIEPSAAVTIGVLLENPGLLEGMRTGIILCGGNLTVDCLID